MQMPSGRGGYEECIQFTVKLRSAFPPVGHAAISQMSLSQTQRETDTESDRQTDTEGGQEHEGCFIGMFLDSICLLNSGLWYCFMS